MKLAELNLSEWTSRCLEAAGILNIEELCKMTRNEILNTQNLGPMSVGEIAAALGKHILRIKRKLKRAKKKVNGLKAVLRTAKRLR
jgi:DNA-directed RNA polymerase alpha subunit